MSENYRLMNITVRFNATVGQMTETSQWTKRLSEK